MCCYVAVLQILKMEFVGQIVQNFITNSKNRDAWNWESLIRMRKQMNKIIKYTVYILNVLAY